jgi:phage-related baseplate assembly protein
VSSLLDMSQIPLPAAVSLPDYESVRTAWLTRYAELMGVDVGDLDDNDPAVHALEVGAYRETLLLARINDAVRDTLLASASGQGLDDIGADPVYDTERLVLDPGDPEAVPPVPPVMEAEAAYRLRLQLAPSALSVAGPAGAYESRARSAHVDVVDVAVSSPAPSEVLVEVLHASADPDILTDVAAALSDISARPVGDRVTVESADKEAHTFLVTVYVPDGPDLESVRAASQARVEQVVYPLAAKVRSGDAFLEGDTNGFLGACVVPGVRTWEVTGGSGSVAGAQAWWPLTITVTAERSNA